MPPSVFFPRTQTLTLDVPHRLKILKLQSWGTSSMATSCLSYNGNSENGKFTVSTLWIVYSGAVGLLLSSWMNVGGPYGHRPTGLKTPHDFGLVSAGRWWNSHSHNKLLIDRGLIQATKRSVFQSCIQLQLNTGIRDTTFSFIHIDNVV